MEVKPTDQGFIGSFTQSTRVKLNLLLNSRFFKVILNTIFVVNFILL